MLQSACTVFCVQLQRGRAASELANSSTESLRSESSSVLSPPPEPPLQAGASFSFAAVSQPISIAQSARPTSASSTTAAGNKQLTYIGQPGEQVGPATVLKARF